MKPDHKRLLFKTMMLVTQASGLVVIPFLLFGRDRRIDFALAAFVTLIAIFAIVVARHRCRHCGYRMVGMDLPTPEMMARARRWVRLSDFDHCPGCGRDPFSPPEPGAGPPGGDWGGKGHKY